jgi:hypothetical protein
MSSVALSMMVTISALAQIGVRTGRPTVTNRDVLPQEAARAGQMAVAETADNEQTIRMELEPRTS